MADKKNKEEKELMDIFEDKRSFIHNGEKYYIDNADFNTIRGADWHYAQTFNEAMSLGIMTVAQMQNVLIARGVIGKEWEEKRQKILTTIDEKTAELNEAKDRDSKLQLATELKELRDELFRHNQIASSPTSQAAENLADDARVEFLTSAMIKDSDGKSVWQSYEDFKTSEGEKMALAMRSRYEVMLYLSGMSSNFMDLLPESKAMKDLEEEDRLLEDAPKDEGPKKKK